MMQQQYGDYQKKHSKPTGPYQSAMLDRFASTEPEQQGFAQEYQESASLPKPVSGNTGISGGMGGTVYSGGQASQPIAMKDGPAFNGSNYQEYIMGLLGGGTTSEQKLRSITEQLKAIGVENQIASDGTARGRIHIPGIGPVTLINDKQTWGDGGWAWRTGNDNYGSGGGGGPLTGGGSPVSGTGGVDSAFIQALMKLLNPTQASLADPDLASQSKANQVAQQRSYERRRASAAERAAAGGQMGGALDANIDTLLSSRGDAESAFDADLLARKNDQNRQSQLAALGPAMGLLGLNQNESQFSRNIALQKALAEAGLNQQAIMNLLNGL